MALRIVISHHRALMSDVTVYYDVPGCRISSRGRVMCLVFLRELTIEGVRATLDAGMRLDAETRGQGYGVCTYYEAGLSVPSAEMRETISEITRKSVSLSVVARTIVLPDKGFWASAMQAVYTATTSVGSARIPQRFCSNDHEAAGFMAQHVLDDSWPVLAKVFQNERAATRA